MRVSELSAYRAVSRLGARFRCFLYWVMVCIFCLDWTMVIVTTVQILLIFKTTIMDTGMDIVITHIAIRFRQHVRQIKPPTSMAITILD